MRLALLAGDHIRHKYFAFYLAKRHDLALVISEEKGNESQKVGENNEDTLLLSDHFKALEKEQVSFFGNLQNFPSASETVYVESGGVNDAFIGQKVKELKIEGIAVFGCGIIKPHIFDCCPGKVVNAHQGLSPYYRGSGTNFWPFVNGEPEYVGVTVHYIDAGIDTGGIICHGRPYIEKGDTMHGIGCKVIEVSARLVSEVFFELDKGRTVRGVPQWFKGDLYQRKDFNAAAVRKARKNITAGLIDRCVDNRQKGTLPKIQLVEFA